MLRETEQRRSLLPPAAVLLGALALFALVTRGSGVLTVPETRGNVYDSMAERLPAGDASVDRFTITWEGFQRGGRMYTYFGPLPGFLRMLPNAVVPRMRGRWSRSSVLLASLLSVLAMGVAARDALARTSALSPRARNRMLALCLTGAAIGSPIAFLASSATIYHEAISWGLCGGLWGAVACLRLARNPASIESWLLLSSAYAVALLSRVTFALPLALGGAFFAVDAAVRRRRGHGPGLPVGWLVLAATPAFAATAFQLWYDQARFGSPWIVMDSAYTFYIRPDRFGGVFNLRRLPDCLNAYWGPAGRISAEPPFVEFQTVRYSNPRIFFGWRDQTFSLTVASAWMTVAAALGAFVALHRDGRRPYGTVGALFVPQAVLISCYYFVTHRFGAEYLPLLTVLLAAYLASPLVGGSVGRFLPVFVLLSAITTLAGTVQWNVVFNGDASEDDKARLARLFLRPPALSEDAGLTRIFLGTLAPAEARGLVSVDRTVAGQPIRLRARIYERGIAMRAPAAATWPIPPGATAFEAVLGLPDELNRYWTSSVVFELSDERGVVLYRSAVLGNAAPPFPIRVALGGSRSLRLALGDAGSPDERNHAVWASAAFLIPGGH